MRTLVQLCRYNTWANARVFACCLAVDPAAIGAEAKGTTGTIEQTLKHLVGVEEVYLAMLRDQDLERTLPPQEEYQAHDLAWFADRAAELGRGYLGLVETADEPFLEAELKVPWFERPINRRAGILQALTHSLQHRAQVLSTLGERGLEVPNVDLVLMLQEG
jgi:uncharacterized damage-inducible protein DinB